MFAQTFFMSLVQQSVVSQGAYFTSKQNGIQIGIYLFVQTDKLSKQTLMRNRHNCKYAIIHVLKYILQLCSPVE